ncbi:unnamed protein product [Umbelopsis ramanniana]
MTTDAAESQTLSEYDSSEKRQIPKRYYSPQPQEKSDNYDDPYRTPPTPSTITMRRPNTTSKRDGCCCGCLFACLLFFGSAECCV